MNTRVGTTAISSMLLAAIFTLAGCSSQPRSAGTAPEIVRDIAVLDVRPTALPDVIESVGTVRAAESAPLAAQVMANIVSVNVHEGDRVRRGQVLAVLDDAQLRAAAERARAAVSAANHESAAAESEYALASATLKRYQDLFEKKAVSPQEFDEVKARAQAATARREGARAGQSQAQAALAQARTMLGYTQIRAPFDGIVTEKRVDPGAMATPGTPLMTIEALRGYRLEADVDESSLHYIQIGQKVAAQVDALGGKRLQGKVVQIIPAADSASRSFTVKIELPADAQLRSGLFGRAYFTRGEREALVVPRTAVVERGQLQGVYVVGSDQIATLRYVSLGKTDGDTIEILSGLRSGERLVAAPGTRDLSGKKLQ
jgi:RND family efflux transporter MFP subunit